MPREKKYASRAEQQAAYRERKAREENPPEPDTTVAPLQVEPESLRVTGEEERLEALAADLEEHEALTEHGYSSSEQRTKEERNEAARRMVERSGVVNTGVVLPPDILAVWTGESADTARYLIGQWGEEAFRRSAVHRSALAEIHHKRLQAEARARYEKAKA